MPDRSALPARLIAALLAAASSGLLVTAGAAPHPLAFTVRQGRFLNEFYRQGPVAADLVLRSGPDPRLIVAFPAGDSGVGIWFAREPNPVRWQLLGRPRPVRTVDRQGRPLYGISAVVQLHGAAALQVHRAVLSSIRVLREYGSLGRLPPGIAVAPRSGAQRIVWVRQRLDGALSYQLRLRVLRGRLQGTRMLSDSAGVIRVRITGLTGEPPLSPLAGRALLRHPRAGSRAARDTLTFLAYRQKFLAGSWRFDTYFGRDTLMSLRLLMPALTAGAIDDALDSVLARLSAHGQVAHEEDIGEEAVLENLKRGLHSAAPSYTYLMVDENYMLAPDAAAWLLNRRERSQAAAFLAAPVGGPQQRLGTHGAALVRNLRYVLASATPFARDPSRRHLIGLKPGIAVGDWRDSPTGLGGGYYPYDVNAALVPAALTAIARLYASGLLAPYVTVAERPRFAEAAGMARVWSRHVSQWFQVVVPHAAAVRAVRSYAALDGVPARPAVLALGQGPVRFPALSLTRAGKPVPVMHSDVGYLLLFGKPTARALARLVTVLMRPFPAGLITGAGLVVANPVFAPRVLQAQFTRHAYHGTVVWSWQQALLAAGLARQLRRTDLPPPVRARLRTAQRTLWRVIAASRSMANTELWSWTCHAGRYRIRPFGSASTDASEADAAQLWSTVYLAIKPPRHLRIALRRAAQ